VPRDVVRFLRRGRVIERRDFAPAETLLDHLRLRERALGTKEGCAEGDCGACTVAVGRLRDGRPVYEPVNACIQLLGMVDGAEVVTADDLAPSNRRLHPVQQALVDAHASQCGLCTPGFVMSLFALYHAGVRADRATVNDWLAGNRIAAVATDTWGFEVRPNETPDVYQPMHIVVIVHMGLWVGEIFDLDPLARDCSADGVYEFFFCGPPLPFTRAVGSPLNPMAIK